MASTKTSGVYSITNTVDGKIYIGSADNIHRRWIAHRTLLRRNRHENVHLQNAWCRHGEAAFTFAVLETCAREDVLVREQAALDRIFAERPRQDIYNVARCAEAPMRGAKHSMLTSLRRSVALQGKKRSPETRARMCLAQRGRTVSEEAKRNISASKSGQNHPNWGKHLSEETRQKIGVWHRGSQRSEETKRRISASKSGANHPCWGKRISAETIQKRTATRKLNAITRRQLEVGLGF